MGLLTATWRWVVAASAAPGPASGTTWRCGCAARFDPASRAAEPVGSGCPADAPYSSTWRSRRRPPSACPEPASTNLPRETGSAQDTGHTDHMSGDGEDVTWLTASVWPEAPHRHLTACHQQQSSAFIHNTTVSQNRFNGFMQDAESLFRNPQHQLQDEPGTDQLHRLAKSQPILKYSSDCSGRFQ